jgi:two-component system, OmpR family, response regulator CssR
MSFRIHLVEDEDNLNQVLTSYLQKEGWDVHSFLRGEEAKASIGQCPHLWILDIMLPDIDGYQLLQEIKGLDPNVPIIFISARDADLDRVIGLEMGSDDYLPKPFLPRELVIRTQKLLTRVYGKKAEIERCIIECAPYSIEEAKRLVMENGEIIDLTSKETELLLLFVKNPGQAFSREQILNHVWGEDYFGSDRVVDDLVRRMRKKLPKLHVETLYGYGYRMVKV